jgi:hypothetical protein
MHAPRGIALLKYCIHNCLPPLLLQESFFCRVLEVMADKDIALCLTPQK